MTATYAGRLGWSGSRDDEGHRTYRIEHLVKTTSVHDGPSLVMVTPGLPAIGAPWVYGNFTDAWAFCYPSISVSEYAKPADGEPHKLWKVTQVFSTKPLKRCQDANVEDPLLEPQKISGSFILYTKEAGKDRFGNPILNSANTPIQGVEKDEMRPKVVIEQNVANLGLETFSEQVNTLNDAPLWGLAKRKIKLGAVSFDRNIWGLCNFYFTRRFEFDINFNTFDREDIADIGLMRLNDDGDLEVIKDGNGENINQPVMLDGNGKVNANPVANPVFIDKVELYDESDFLQLGIPTTLQG